MTTSAHIRKVIQPLLQRRSDLALVQRFLILKPVNHFIRGVHLRQFGGPNHLRLTLDVNINFMGITMKHYGWGGQRLMHLFFTKLAQDIPDNYERALALNKIDTRPYDWDRNNSENMAAMLEVIDDALEPLRKLTRLEDIIAFTKRDENNFTPFEVKYYARIVMATALGDFDEAIRILDGSSYDQRELRRRLLHSHPIFYPALLAGDRQELAKFLHEEEMKTIKALKYTKIWERTPFPLELQSS